MRVICWVNNDSPAWLDKALSLAAARYPAARAVIRNPDQYRSQEREDAIAVVVESWRTQVVTDYRTAGVVVLTEADAVPVAPPVAEPMDVGAAVARGRLRRAAG